MISLFIFYISLSKQILPNEGIIYYFKQFILFKENFKELFCKTNMKYENLLQLINNRDIFLMLIKYSQAREIVKLINSI